MKTDDGVTRQRDEVEGDEAKVVRLSDWLAPDDELVPFGPRARAQAATPDPADERAEGVSDGQAPAASGFWDGDPSVHTAVPGPGIFDEPGEPTGHRRRYRRPVSGWRPALPSVYPFGWGSRTREFVGDLVDRISLRWAAAGVAFAALALIVLVISVGGGGDSSSRHHTVAQAGIGEPAPAALTETLAEIGSASQAASVSGLRRLPPVDRAAARTIGTAAQHARSLRARHRRHVLVSPASVPSSSASGSVETPTTAAPAETTTSAPSETEPVQTTPNPTPTTGSGGSASGGSGSTGGGSGSGSQQQSTFGATGSLGPGSSPNG